MQTEFKGRGIDPHALQLPPYHSVDITDHVLAALAYVPTAQHNH